jgi:hypothetical protein
MQSVEVSIHQPVSISNLTLLLRVLLISFLQLLGCITEIGQQISSPDALHPQTQSSQSNSVQNPQQHKVSKNHIFWIIPNYRSDENTTEIKPLTPRGKFKVALDDSFDPSAFLVAGVFAGVSMA